MPQDTPELVSPMSLVLLTPVLAVLDKANTARLKPVGSLPSPCLQIPSVGTVVCATSVHSIAMFRAEMIALAANTGVDVVLLRHGAHPETLDDLSYDVVTGRDRALRMLWDLIPYRHSDDSYWLVPPVWESGTSVRMTAHGLSASAEPPYRDVDERSDGLGRAARDRADDAAGAAVVTRGSRSARGCHRPGEGRGGLKRGSASPER